MRELSIVLNITDALALFVDLKELTGTLRALIFVLALGTSLESISAV